MTTVLIRIILGGMIALGFVAAVASSDADAGSTQMTMVSGESR